MHIGKVLYSKTIATADCDSHYCVIALAYRNYPIFVVMPKVAKASTVLTVTFCHR
jgi:hypothetical protein